MRLLFSAAFCLFLSLSPLAQDSVFVRAMIDSLCAPRYDGRGYVNAGDVRASNFIARQLSSLGAEAVAGSFFQPFELDVNTFPGRMHVSLNGRSLSPGIDFLIQPVSRGIHGNFEAEYITPKTLGKKDRMLAYLGGQAGEKIVVLDEKYVEKDEAYTELLKGLASNPLKAKGYIVLTGDKLTWHVGRKPASTTVLTIDKRSLKGRIKTVEMAIDQEYIPAYPTQNVLAKVPGQRHDSIIVFTAHYDHLGRMGEDTYIPGASDNASGTAMLLDYVRHYRTHPPLFDTYFLFFAGEEAGLVGSSFFVEHPKFELEKIKFLVNLDLTGDAKTGITAVNGKVYERQYRLLNAVNDSLGGTLEIKARGEAPNSDHYPFYKKGVPCFFIYTRGEYTHYHDVFDKPENLPLTNYNELFTLILEFVEAL